MSTMKPIVYTGEVYTQNGVKKSRFRRRYKSFTDENPHLFMQYVGSSLPHEHLTSAFTEQSRNISNEYLHSSNDGNVVNVVNISNLLKSDFIKVDVDTSHKDLKSNGRKRHKSFMKENPQLFRQYTALSLSHRDTPSTFSQKEVDSESNNISPFTLKVNDLSQNVKNHNNRFPMIALMECILDRYKTISKHKSEYNYFFINSTQILRQNSLSLFLFKTISSMYAKFSYSCGEPYIDSTSHQYIYFSVLDIFGLTLLLFFLTLLSWKILFYCVNCTFSMLRKNNENLSIQSLKREKNKHKRSCMLKNQGCIDESFTKVFRRKLDNKVLSKFFPVLSMRNSFYVSSTLEKSTQMNNTSGIGHPLFSQPSKKSNTLLSNSLNTAINFDGKTTKSELFVPNAYTPIFNLIESSPDMRSIQGSSREAFTLQSQCLASVLSRIGLDEQKAIEIATQAIIKRNHDEYTRKLNQYDEWRRIAVQEKWRIENDVACQRRHEEVIEAISINVKMEPLADKAFCDVWNDTVHLFSNTQYNLCCFLMGSFTWILALNSSKLWLIQSKDRIRFMGDLFASLVLSQICGCEYTQDDNISSLYSRCETFACTLPFYLGSSVSCLGKCFLKEILIVTIIIFIHNALNTCRSPQFVHQLLNIISITSYLRGNKIFLLGSHIFINSILTGTTLMLAKYRFYRLKQNVQGSNQELDTFISFTRILSFCHFTGLTILSFITGVLSAIH